MKNTFIISSILLFVAGLYSCDEKAVDAGFEEQENMTIYDYIVENEDQFSSFLHILEAGGIDKTLSAYNPYGTGYTLFLPNNNAINDFIGENERFPSLDGMIQDHEYCADFSRYHVVLMDIDANDFPFGALPEFTMSGDLLTVNFVVEEDTAYYKINNQAPVIKPNIEVSNGFVHVIMSALKPINFTTFEWFEDHSGYSIFKSALEATGLQEALSINIKDETSESSGLTLLIEPDAVYNKRNILTFEDLVAQISPDNSDYTNTLNPLYTYTAYHILTDNLFLVDFEDDATNYSTYSDIPVLIDGLGLDIAINKGKEIFDTIVSGPDTTFIDFVGFDYDASNVITQSGALHVIDQILKPKQPSRANKNYEFFEEPLLWEYRLEAGEYLIDDTSSMRRLKWTGADLIFVIKGSPDEINAWNEDYLYINGDFTITYTIPKLVQGRYTVYLGAELYTRDNAVVEVSIDGKNLGGLVNLATGGSSNYPFNRKELGTVDFVKFEEHVIKIQSLIPGSFYWDYIRFEPN